jgi:subtilisin-like proprotein convertase family protein
MMKVNKLFIYLFLIAALFSEASAQPLSVSGGFTAKQLAQALAGPNITVFNATLTGAPISYGMFNNGNSTNLGINNGIILTSGDRNLLLGPNNTSDATGINNTSGDADLSTLAGQPTLDATVLQFQFEVQSESIEFSYVFGSEEYIEYIDGEFNDIFAFFISGPGIIGKENIAVIPNTADPVMVSTVNSFSYWQYYIDNPWGGGGTEKIQYDGFTRVLKAKKTGLIPCEVYTLKLAIADGAGMISDNTWDSGVMLQAGSLVQGSVNAITNTIKADSVAVEGCVNASFTFSLDEPRQQPNQIKFKIAGTAINGVDYQYIDSLFTIPAGQKSASVVIEPYADGYTEGRESVLLIYEPRPCAPPDTVFLYIDDATPVLFSLSGTNLTCAGDSSGQISVEATGGFPPYSYTIVGQGTYNSTPITGLPAGTYTIRTDDSYGCLADALSIGAVYDTGAAVFLPDGNGQSYETIISIEGFPAGQTMTSISQLQSICINMEHSFLGELEISIIAPDNRKITLKQHPGGTQTHLGEPVKPPQGSGNADDLTPGVGYDYCFTVNPLYGTMVNESKKYTYTYVSTAGTTLSGYYLPSGSYESFEPFANLIGAPLNGNWKIRVTDKKAKDNGFIFNWSISFQGEKADSTITITEPSRPVFSSPPAVITQPGCGMSNGAINITISGINTPFTYLWSTDATTEDISGIPAGAYELNLKDKFNCEYDTTFLVQNSGTFDLSFSKTNVSCKGSSDGTIVLTIAGGTEPFAYSWSNGALTRDLSDLAPGNYLLAVQDAAGCKALAEVNISEPLALSLQGMIVNEKCGKKDGSINLNTSGGKSPYSFLWSNGSTSEDLQFLQAGTYNVTVTDANGCSAVVSYTTINEVSNCVINCDIAIKSGVVTNEICGNKAGALDITVEKGIQPFSYSWSNGAVTQDLSGLSAGNYTLTVRDINQCEVSQTYTVNNLTGTLAITGQSVTNEICGNKQGAINITVSGGALPYSFNWSNSKTTEDINQLSAGTYAVTIMDANNCAISESFTVINNSGNLTQTYGNALDEVCGNGKGSIDITISGGTTPYFYKWSNNAVSQDLINLSAGTYSCVITDGSGCKISTPLYTVSNNSETLKIFEIDVYNEICGNSLGRININMQGGAVPYVYNWNTGEVTQSISNLSAGVYNCTVRDNNNCTVSTGDISVSNTAGTLVLNSVSVLNEICSNNNGSVSVDFSGGSAPYAYRWSNGFTSQNISGLSAGTYSCKITDKNGCSISAEGTLINTSGTLAVTNAIITNEFCGNGQGAVNLIMSGGTLPYTFRWNNGATTEDISGVNGGIFICNINDASGCSVNTSATVGNQAGTLALGVPVVTSEICGNEEGSVNISVSGGSAPYSFLWSNGAVTEDISGLAAGNYSCMITDNAGCIINTGIITVINFAGGLGISLNSLVHEICSEENGEIQIAVSGGTLPYNILWNTGDTGLTLEKLSAGTYSVTVTDQNGCSLKENFAVNNSSGSLMISGFTLSNEVCGNGQGAINLSLSGGSAPYSFSWNNGSSFENLSSISAGTYSCTITDNAGCTLNTENFIIQNSSGTLSASAFVINEECSDGNGEIFLSVTGGTAPVNFSWSNGSGDEDLSGLSAGTYTCTIFDNAGCSMMITANVFNNSGTLSIDDIIITDATCGAANGAVGISVSGGTEPYSFLWNNGAETSDISGLSQGIYNCTISDNACCTAGATVSVKSIGADLKIFSIVVTDQTCQTSGAVDISVSGGNAPYTYLWSNGSFTQDISGLIAGTYSVTVADKNGCTAAGSAVVALSTNYALIVSGSTTFCQGESVFLYTSVSGSGFTYQWTKNGVNISGAINSGYTATASGEYAVKITRNGCMGTTSPVIINVKPQPLLIIEADGPAEFCQGGSVTLNATYRTEYIYQWRRNGLSLSGETTSIYTASTTGIYSVLVQFEGCTATTSVSVTVNEYPSAAFTASTSGSFCEGDSVKLTATENNINYQWYKNGIEITGENSQYYYVTGEGSYFLEAMKGGCSTISSPLSFTLLPSPEVQITVAGSTSLCAGESVLLKTELNQNYVYQWYNGTEALPGATSFEFLASSSGIFSVIVSNINNCKKRSDGVNVMVSDYPSALILASGPLSFCKGSSVNLSAGAANQYLWSTGETSSSIIVKEAGVYNVLLTGNNSCAKSTMSADILVSVYDPPEVPLLALNGTVISASSYTAYSYMWYVNGQPVSSNESNIFTVFAAGEYYLEVKTAEGCTAVSEKIIVREDQLTSSEAVKIFPNPFFEKTTISYRLIKKSKVTLEIFNLLGDLIEIPIADVMQDEGVYTYSLNRFDAGTYYFRLQIGNELHMHRVISIK